MTASRLPARCPLRLLCWSLLFCAAQATYATDAADGNEPPLAPPQAAAEEVSTQAGWREAVSRAGITGSLRAGYWSSNRRQDDEHDIAVPSAWLKLDKRFESGIGVFAEGYLANEDVFGERRGESRLREGYVEGRHGKFDYRLGKQIIAWGRADRLNPTDNLTPRDATLLAADIDEDRFGSLAAKGSWSFDLNTSLIGVWIPQFKPNVIGLPARPGVVFQENVPDSQRQWALKLDQSGKAIDWSLSWFDGYDLSADLSAGALTPAGQVVNLDHHRIRVLGADAATTLGAYRFALEGAHVRTEDADGNNPGIKNPYFYGVFGVERDFADTLVVIVQVFTRQVSHYRDPELITNPAVRALAVQQAIGSAQYDRSQQGASMRVAKKWFNETLDTELACAALFGRYGYLLRPRVTWLYSDSIKLIGGYEWFKGSDKTIYGLLEKNKALFAEVRWFF